MLVATDLDAFFEQIIAKGGIIMHFLLCDEIVNGVTFGAFVIDMHFSPYCPRIRNHNANKVANLPTSFQAIRLSLFVSRRKVTIFLTTDNVSFCSFTSHFCLRQYVARWLKCCFSVLRFVRVASPDDYQADCSFPRWLRCV